MSFDKAVATPLQSSTLHRQARRGESHRFDGAGPAAGAGRRASILQNVYDLDLGESQQAPRTVLDADAGPL